MIGRSFAATIAAIVIAGAMATSSAAAPKRSCGTVPAIGGVQKVWAKGRYTCKDARWSVREITLKGAILHSRYWDCKLLRKGKPHDVPGSCTDPAVPGAKFGWNPKRG